MMSFDIGCTQLGLDWALTMALLMMEEVNR